jgi:chromosome partitioning protein
MDKMNIYETEGITQRTMALLAKVSPAAVSRFISNNKIRHIDNGTQRNCRYSIDDSRKVISSLSKFPKSVKHKIQAFYNFKGGTGKTSLCYQVASHVALMGYKVLAIDADPQAHLSTSLGFSNENSYLTLYDSLTGKMPIQNLIHTVYPGLDCIPSGLALSRLESELNHLAKREERLKIEIAKIQDNYDFIFIDTNPTISFINRNVETVSDILNIVCETQPYSLNGLRMLMEDLDQFFAQMQIKNKSIFIVPNKYEDRTASSGEAMSALRQFYSEFTKENFAVRKSEDIVISSKLSKPLAFFAKKNSIALYDIIELVHYIITFSV